MIQRPSDLSEVFFESVPELREIEAPIKRQNLRHQCSARDIESEYELLRAITASKKHKLLLRTNGVFENKLNRYAELQIYEHSRVVLKREDTKQLDYINANYVRFPDRSYIITQGPLPTTVGDFFQMVAQEKVKTIVMLCNVVEDGRVRCEAYFDNLPQPYHLQSSEELLPRKITKRTILNQLTGDVVQHLHFSDWPDKDVPKDFSTLWQLLQILEGCSGETLLHCSAGIGRSGAILTVLECLQELGKKGEVSVFGVARLLREQRYGAIQNLLQYQFCYDFLAYCVDNSLV